MVALQILVLSVWVRVLVRQQRDREGLFFVVLIYGREPSIRGPKKFHEQNRHKFTESKDFGRFGRGIRKSSSIGYG